MIKSTEDKETESLREAIFLDKVVRLFFQGDNSWSQRVDILGRNVLGRDQTEENGGSDRNGLEVITIDILLNMFEYYV